LEFIRLILRLQRYAFQVVECGPLFSSSYFFFFFQAEDGIRDRNVTGVQTCALPISTVRLPPLERQTVEQELVERVVDQRGVVGLGLLRLGVYHAIWRPEQNVEDTDLRAAPVPGVALRHRDRALPTKHKAHHAGLVLEGHVLSHAKARFPREVALEREHPRLLVLAHHGFCTLNT